MVGLGLFPYFYIFDSHVSLMLTLDCGIISLGVKLLPYGLVGIISLFEVDFRGFGIVC